MKRLSKGFLPLIILIAGLAAGAWLFFNPQEAQKRPRPEAPALLVETAAPETGSYTATVEAMGRVAPAIEIALKPQVSGEIIEASAEFLPGGRFKKGEEILKIDPANYKLAVQKQEAILRQAEADYRLELGRQSVAKDELAILERTTGRKPENPELALRGPQREQAEAELEKARIDLEIAKLDLGRTVVTAPFNALVVDRLASPGDKVSPSETLAALVGTDEYWVALSVPVHELQWLHIPQSSGEKGSPALIILDGGRGVREGHLLKLTGNLDQESRLAGLLVAIPDPLLLAGLPAEQGSPLILNDYVRVVLDGRRMEDVIRIPLTWRRDGDIVWVNEGGRLAFRPVMVVYEDRDYAYIGEGLKEGDMIVTSDIAVPVEGMKIRTVEEARSMARDKMKGFKGVGDE